MKITLFTSNQPRHIYLINYLSQIASDLFVVQETSTVFPGIIPGHYPVSGKIGKYFKNVSGAQKKIFSQQFIKTSKKNINLISLQQGDLNKCTLNFLSRFLKSDLYVIFGSSYIKGDLINFLIKNKAINIHMGISPYYRGTDCNFWALYDNNPHLVGATIHYISKGLDSGSILYHALSEQISDPFLYSMSTVKSAFWSLKEKIKNKTIFKLKEDKQDKNKEIRYSTKKQFDEIIVNRFFNKKINMNFKLNFNLYKNPFILKKTYFSK